MGVRIPLLQVSATSTTLTNAAVSRDIVRFHARHRHGRRGRAGGSKNDAGQVSFVARSILVARRGARRMRDAGQQKREN
jgi:hypothetical protein